MVSQLERTLRVNRLFDLYGPLLTERQRRAIYLYYSMDLSLGEIADRTNVTRQAIHDSLLRAVASLEEVEDNLGFLERWERLRGLTGELRDCLGNEPVRSDSCREIVSRITDLNPLS